MRFRKFWESCKVFPPRTVVGGWAEPQRVFGWMPGSQDMRLTCLNRIRKVSIDFRRFSEVFVWRFEGTGGSAGIRSAT